MNEIVKTASNAPIYLCAAATDMRLGLPGLAKKVQGEAKKNPRGKAIYVFVSRDFRRVKLFYWDRDGYAMWYKHAPSGSFRIEWKGGYPAITGVNLKRLLVGAKKKKEIAK